MNFFQKFKLKSLQKKLRQMIQTRRQTSHPSEPQIQKEIALHKELAKFYTKHLFDKDVKNAEIWMIESYRAAASLGDVDALYRLSELLIKKARLWREIGEGIYSAKVHEKYAKDLFEEALTYLAAAEERGHALAKRLHGLAYINGWGVEIDKDKGFKFVVESIEQENAWNKATQIFEETGLNKPEFFESIMSIRQKNMGKRS